ncbi:BMP family ABC transporter substrate-binding protein [Aestuariivirga litoralis]|uniref:BMP family ABC transporter substrate-binding protein n=1 Tax=Aestuariivirga litoralis TaxID=2650924 RepID=A0A2W2C8X0_9HYPH|nr:BMP family ABC transporter substrate-binding protein [Aestuariivirga litoralis]PZF76653.1 BMP family ABC transporter substrate-binding protein [Aestuariivirga litoralis]
MLRRSLLAAVAALAMSATAALAADDKPAIVFDIGGKFDKSFNESMFNGSEKFKKETGIAYGEFEIANEAQREQAIRNFADQGYSPIIAAGFAQAAALEKVAKEYPDLKFAIVDMVVDLPNVQSIVFKEEEGSYLVGLLAGMASKSGKVGFVGGMDIPLIRKFGCGYAQGVKAAKADATVIQNMTGDTGAAWNDPVKGGEITKGQMAQGADVIYAAAGATGLGVLQAAADGGALSIGVDANQNYLHPGKVLTSMLKRVDVAVFNVMMSGKDGSFTPGIKVLGLAEDGVGYAVDDNNKPLLTPEMTAAAEKARADIIAGTIKVHDYTTDNTCPVQ